MLQLFVKYNDTIPYHTILYRLHAHVYCVLITVLASYIRLRNVSGSSLESVLGLMLFTQIIHELFAMSH